ncbi:MAG TPA: molecular chaperone TorD family protein [Vicinamibacterales bacterium]|nr:molecular chaperone TorD family protein [Vicinamibacterales bacterium]
MTPSIALLARVAPLFGRLLEEPGDDRRTVASAVQEMLREDAPSAADLVGRFASAIDTQSLDALRELYASTFDLSPVCVPYASVHLFGDESFKRAGLMGALAEAYRDAGFEPGHELPDHVATMFRFLPKMTPEEQQDLAHFVLRPSIDRMAQALFGSRNPYRHVLDALRGLLAASVQVEAIHA